MDFQETDGKNFFSNPIDFKEHFTEKRRLMSFSSVRELTGLSFQTAFR